MITDQKTIAEEVISKLKDDGDFDRLRLKIVRQLKQNDDLRNNIISAVKQSAALNRPGAEDMKPRQLCDAIHDEIREKAMSQISDGLWEIIRSGGDMKTEIRETVQSVYDKLLNPQKTAEVDSTSSLDQVTVRQENEFSKPVMVSGESNGTMTNGEPKEVPGFSRHSHMVTNSHDSLSESQKSSPDNKRLPEQERELHRCSPSTTKEKDDSPSPGLSPSGKRKRASDGSDEDPDIPPGFG
ncbi:putative ciliary rootlet coiled-coil protein 2 [Bienertia sinuspersici]